jgi:hypothetical protein
MSISELNRAVNEPCAAPEALFADFVARAGFPCLGAKAAFNSGSYQLRSYPRLADSFSSEHLAIHLEEFQYSELRQTNDYATFIAVFHEPRNLTEEEFERLLWSQLQQLHEIDARRHEWDPLVSSDPADPHFSFSFAGAALYVIGLHPNSSRISRQFSYPTLVFNPHEQFNRLREEGRWRKMQEAIRRRDTVLQGNINPMLSDFGTTSEARQYSGRPVTEDWRAPFQKTSGPSDGARCPFMH